MLIYKPIHVHICLYTLPYYQLFSYVLPYSPLFLPYSLLFFPIRPLFSRISPYSPKFSSIIPNSPLLSPSIPVGKEVWVFLDTLKPVVDEDIVADKENSVVGEAGAARARSKQEAKLRLKWPDLKLAVPCAHHRAINTASRRAAGGRHVHSQTVLVYVGP